MMASGVRLIVTSVNVVINYCESLVATYCSTQIAVHVKPASVAQRQSVGLGIEKSRVRNSLVPSGFSFRQGN